MIQHYIGLVKEAKRLSNGTGGKVTDLHDRLVKHAMFSRAFLDDFRAKAFAPAYGPTERLAGGGTHASTRDLLRDALLPDPPYGGKMLRLIPLAQPLARETERNQVGAKLDQLSDMAALVTDARHERQSSARAGDLHNASVSARIQERRLAQARQLGAEFRQMKQQAKSLL